MIGHVTDLQKVSKPDS